MNWSPIVIAIIRLLGTIIALLGTITVAYFGYRQVIDSLLIKQTAEAKLSTGSTISFVTQTPTPSVGQAKEDTPPEPAWTPTDTPVPTDTPKPTWTATLPTSPHVLIPLGGYVLDWEPDSGDYRLWTFDPEKSDPLPYLKQAGSFSSITGDLEYWY